MWYSLLGDLKFMIFIIVAVVTCALDQLLKHWVTANIALGGFRQFIPNVLSLTYIENTGAAFSMFSEHTWILALISVGASIAILWFIFKGKLSFWEKISLSVVLGGAVGNAIDRVFNGFVVDMFKVELFNYAIFNLADAFIDVGAVIFVILYFVRVSKEEKQKKLTSDNGEDADGGN
jgi:signal peptidase II